jgi:hypothetical protein
VEMAVTTESPVSWREEQPPAPTGREGASMKLRVFGFKERLCCVLAHWLPSSALLFSVVQMPSSLHAH